MSSTTARTIRIHELAKKITLGDGEFLARAHELGHLKDVTEPLEIKKALCAVLKEMGCDVKSVSSTVGLLISDEILDKFAGRNKAPAPAPAEPP
ncbi:MAG: hypothetical protein LBR12_04465, partial [Opitutaceae bacterium]|nr:hypothetical protein [Opitutaceae bacterium]